MKKGFYLIVLLLVFSLSAFGQKHQLFDDFKAMYIKYQNMAKYELSFTVKYLNEESKVALQQKGKVIHSAKLHYVNFNGMITLVRETEFINVDNNTDELVYYKKKKIDKSPTESLNISSILDSLYLNQKNFKYTVLSSSKNIRKIYIQDLKNVNYDGYEVVYNYKTYSLLGYKYYLKAEGNNIYTAIDINYLVENLKPDLSSNFLKTSYYIQGVGRKVKPSEKYSSYRFVNQTQIERDYEN